MRAGWRRVAGVAVAPDAVTVAALVSDGRSLRATGPWLRQPLGPAKGPEALEAAIIAALGQVPQADLVGLDLALPAESGAVLAQALGVPVVSDLAAADRAMGGQGGPLAPFFLHALARHLGRGPLVVLDLGDLARLVWVDPAEELPEAGCLAFDAGPGATGLPDLGGTVDDAMLQAFVQHPFFARRPPKFLPEGPPLPETGHLEAADAQVTLAAAVSAGVALGLGHLPRWPDRLVVTGPGRHDPALLAVIAAGCDSAVVPAEAAGIAADALEAQAAGHLALRVLMGLPTTAPSTTGARAAVGGGVVSRPAAPPP